MKFINFLNRYKYFAIFLIIGLTIFCYPMVKSGFDLIPGNGMDSKSISYILEHSWYWLNRMPLHEEFWSAPFYFPYKNNIAFSDALMGLMPFYWILRTFLSTFSAFQALMAVVSFLNYAAFYYLLKRNFKYSDLASSVGAFIFAFGLMRLFRMVHLNYYSQYLTILALIFLLSVKKENSLLKNNLCFLFAAFFMAMQFYTCYTLAWGFGVIFLFGIFVSLFFKSTRDVIFDFIKSFYKLLFLYFAAFALMLVPFMSHYLQVGSVRTLNDVVFYLQNQMCWIRNVSIIDTLFFKDLPHFTFYERDEITASSGIFTMILAAIGIFFVGKYKATKVVLYSQLALVFFMSCTVNSFFLWQYLYHIIPGIQGIRTIIRISFIGLIIIAIALGALFDYLQKKDKLWAKVVIVISLLLMTVEQIPCFDGVKYDDPNSEWMNYGWSKSAFEAQIKEEADKVPPEAQTLLFIPNMIKTDANGSYVHERDNDYKISATISALGMWVALRKGIYSKNGLSGMGKQLLDTPEYIEYQKVFTVSLDEFNDEKYLLGLEKI